MVSVRLFAQAAELADTGQINIDATSVDEIQSQLVDRFGEDFGQVLAESQIWVNGSSAVVEKTLEASDEVAVLPPVSGG